MKKKKKTGLVLEGGAMRGIYTAGVIDALLENNITFDGVIGVSAGAIHGCNLVSKQYERSLKYYMECRSDYRFLSFKSFLKTGNIIDVQYAYHDIPEKLYKFDHKTFESSKTKFYVVVSNLETGLPEYIYCDNLKEKLIYLRASASMPIISKIVEINGNKYLDGATTDSIPITKFMKMGYEKCVVVKTKVDGSYRKRDITYPLSKIIYHKYPKYLEKIKNRHIMYNETLDEIDRLEQAGKVLVIAPSVDLKVGRLEKDIGKIKKQYDLGKSDTLKRIDEIKKFIEE